MASCPGLCFQVYTTKEVKELLEDLGEEVLQRVDTELENASFASGLLLRLLFQQAEMADLLMEADTNELENEFLLKQVRVAPLQHWLALGGRQGPL